MSVEWRLDGRVYEMLNRSKSKEAPVPSSDVPRGAADLIRSWVEHLEGQRDVKQEELVFLDGEMEGLRRALRLLEGK